MIQSTPYFFLFLSKGLQLTFVAATALVLSVCTAFGDSQMSDSSSPESWKKYVRSLEPSVRAIYRTAASANKTGRVFKFTPKKPYQLQIYCAPEYCKSERVEGLKQFFDFSNFEIFSPIPDGSLVSKRADVMIDIVAPGTIENIIDEQQFRSSEVSSGHMFFFSAGSDRCRSLTVLNPEQHEVKRIVIWVDGSLPNEVFASCIAIAMAQGSGLALNIEFEKAWETNGEVAKLSPAQRMQIFNSIKTLLAMHFSPFVLRGMSVPELNHFLNLN